MKNRKSKPNQTITIKNRQDKEDWPGGALFIKELWEMNLDRKNRSDTERQQEI